MNDDHNPLGPALRERVRDEHPDLDRLVRGSTHAGTRIRRRRQAGGVLVTAAAVAAVAVGADQLLGEDGTTSRGPGFATAPTSSTSTSGPAPQDVNPAGEDITLQELQERLEAAEGTAGGKARPLGHDESARVPEGAPFSVGAPGWACDPPANEKFSCAKGTDSVHLVWRDSVSRPKYLGPDGYGPDTFVSEAHGGIFVTVEPLDGTAPAVATEVGESLVFD
jgi:hypothetical protein